MGGNHYQYKLGKGHEESNAKDITNISKNEWTRGYVFTFWAYDYSHPGTTEYFVYHTTTNPFGGSNNSSRFMLSRYRQFIANDDEDWILAFSFWAFEDDSMKTFIGTKFFSISKISN